MSLSELTLTIYCGEKDGQSRDRWMDIGIPAPGDQNVISGVTELDRVSAYNGDNGDEKYVSECEKRGALGAAIKNSTQQKGMNSK